MLKVRDLFLRHNEQIHITCFNTVLMGLCNTMWQEGHRGHGNDMLLLVVSEDTGTGGDQIHLRKKALTQFNFLTWVQSNLYSELHDVHSWLKSIMQFDFVQPRVSTTAWYQLISAEVTYKHCPGLITFNLHLYSCIVQTSEDQQVLTFYFFVLWLVEYNYLHFQVTRN